MSVTRRRSLAKSSFQIALPGENTLIAILLAAFLSLHILASVILQGAAPIGAAPMQEDAKVSSYD